MFAKTIVLSDAFLDMPLSARCLYFTLGMFADDDGFVNSPKAIMRQCGASEDDLRVLIAKRFLLAFDSGVIVIKHWRINNYLRTDRYTSTKYIEEKDALQIEANGAYTEGSTSGIPSSGIPSIGKVRLDKDSIDKSIEGKAKFSPPSLQDVQAYCLERKNNVDAQKFLDYFTAGNWKDSKGNKVKNWKQKLITWERNSLNNGAEKPKPYKQPKFEIRVIDGTGGGSTD